MRVRPVGIGPDGGGSARDAQKDPVPVGRGTTNIGRAARPA
jgi:hypothetical protein